MLALLFLQTSSALDTINDLNPTSGNPSVILNFTPAQLSYSCVAILKCNTLAQFVAWQREQKKKKMVSGEIFQAQEKEKRW
jgi:hypothetical protein